MKNLKIFSVASLSAAGAILTFLSLSLLSNLAGVELFGQYQYLISLIQIGSIVALPGLLQSTTQSVARGYEGVYFNNIKLSSKIYLSIIFLAIIIYQLGLIPFNFGINFFLFCFSLYPLFILKHWLSILNGRGKYVFTNSILFAEKVIFLFCIYLISSFFEFSLVNIFLAYLIPIAFINIVGTISVRQTNKNVEKGSARFGLITSLALVPNIVANNIEKLFLGASSLISDLGLFAIINSIAESLKLVIQSVISTFTPNFAKGKTDEILKKEVIISFIASITIVIIAILLLPAVFKIFFPLFLLKDHEWLLIASLLFFIPSNLLFTFLRSKLLSETISKIQLFISIFRIILTIILVPYFGLIGAIWSVVGYRLFMFFITTYYFIRYNHSHENKKKIKHS